MTINHYKLRIPYYTISFLLPFIIIVCILFTKNIYWGSPTTILASDGFHQYVIFNQALRNILHGSNSLFYTFTSGLGLNFYALSSYYLGSFLSPIVYFFNLKNMPDAIYLLTICKIGLIGLSMFVTLCKRHCKVNRILLLVISTCYSLMSFSISQIEINMWLDVFILIPLVVLGVDQLLWERKPILYFLSLTALFIQNYYFGFMTAIFTSLYFIVQITRNTDSTVAFKQFLHFTFLSLLAGMTSSIMILPTYFDLTTHGEKLTKVSKMFTENSWYMDLFAKNMIGAYDTTKFGSIPMIYVGLLPLLLSLLYFTIKEVPRRTRLAYGFLLIFVIASFYITPLDLFWQGMHAPNMFLHRYSWVLSVLICLLAAECLEYLDNISWKKILGVNLILVSGFIITFLFKKHYHYLNLELLLLTLTFLSAYIILTISFVSKQIPKLVFYPFLIGFVVLEMTLNTFYQLNSLNNEWVFPSRQGYAKYNHSISKLIRKTERNSSTFFRTERWLGQTGNDSMKYNYNGISQFSSIRNRSSSQVLDRLGFKSDGTNLNLRYQNNTLIADSLFGVKYNLTEYPFDKFGFIRKAQDKQTILYKNQFASQLAILTNQVYQDKPFTVNTLDNQTTLLNQLSGLKETYFEHLIPNSVSGQTTLNKQVFVKKNKQGNTEITYNITIPKNSQLYVSMPFINFNNEENKIVQISVNNGPFVPNTLDNAYSFFNIGSFAENSRIKVKFQFLHNDQVSFPIPHFYGLKLEAYQKAMTVINKRKVKVRTDHNKVIANYTSPNRSSLFFTIPYDRGWKAYQNNKEIKIFKAQKGFMKINIPKGKGKVTLIFIPYGFKFGVGLSITGIVLFTVYYFKFGKNKIG